MNNNLTTNTNWQQRRPSYWEQHLWQVVERDNGGIIKPPVLVSTTDIKQSRKNRQVARKYAALRSQQNPGKIYDVVLYFSSWTVARGQKPFAIDRSYLNGHKLKTEEKGKDSNV